MLEIACFKPFYLSIGFYDSIRKALLYKGSFAHFAAFVSFSLAAYPYAFLLAYDSLRLLCKLTYRKETSTTRLTTFYFPKVMLFASLHLSLSRSRHTRMPFCSLTIRCVCFANLLIGKRLHRREYTLYIYVSSYKLLYPLNSSFVNT